MTVVVKELQFGKYFEAYFDAFKSAFEGTEDARLKICQTENYCIYYIKDDDWRDDGTYFLEYYLRADDGKETFDHTTYETHISFELSFEYVYEWVSKIELKKNEEVQEKQKKANELLDALLYIHAEIIQLNEANEYDPASFAEYSTLVKEVTRYMIAGMK